jgi:hypothetical protein
VVGSCGYRDILFGGGKGGKFSHIRGALQRIEQLKTWFEGEVIVLTERDLYPNV